MNGRPDVKRKSLVWMAMVVAMSVVAGNVGAARPKKPGASGGSDKVEPLTANNMHKNTKARRLTLLLNHYTEMYGKFLGNREPFVRALAVVALGQANATQTTDRLIGALLEERHPIVQLVIWETLHARTRSLTKAQYDRWVEGGLDAGLKGAFRGDLRVGLVKAMGSYGPSGLRGKCGRYATYLKDACKGGNAHDTKTLAALRELGWNGNKGAAGGARYKGTSKIMPAPVVITDPDDRKWLNGLELGDLMISNFDLCFTIDCTGSMLAPMQWVARDVGKMMRVFEFISSRPRIGVVYYRHEVSKDLMAPCCAKFKMGKGKPGPMFATSTFSLTSSVSSLSSRMMKADPRMSNYLHPGGAVHGGLYTALKKQPWASGPKAKKVIVLIGDSPVTPTSPAPLAAAKSLAASMRNNGFTIHGILLKDLPSYATVVRAGGGTSMRMSFGKGGGKVAGGGGGKKPGKGGGKNRGKGKTPKPAAKGAKSTAAPGAGRAGQSPYAKLVSGIVRPLLPREFGHLVDPLMDILLVYAEAEPTR